MVLKASAKLLTCFNCGETGHIYTLCKKPVTAEGKKRIEAWTAKLEARKKVQKQDKRPAGTSRGRGRGAFGGGRGASRPQVQSV